MPLPARPLALTLLLACAGADGAPVTPPPPSSACTAVTQGGIGIVTDPNGPYYHQMAAAGTTDGLTLTNPWIALLHASVPDGVRRADGTVLAYYVNGAEGPVWVAQVLDDSVAPIGRIAVNGVSPPAGVVDPDAWLMPDGKVRLAYFAGFGPPTSTTPKAMCIAESADGINFTVLATALTYPASELLTDPSVVRLADGSWRMAVSWGNRTIMARSADGLAFTRYDTLTYGGVPELAIAPDGALRLYVCAQGIHAYRSVDGGNGWALEGTVVPPNTLGKRILCDPSLVAGANLFIFKTAD